MIYNVKFDQFFLLISIIKFLEKSREIPINFKICIISINIKQDTN